MKSNTICADAHALQLPDADSCKNAVKTIPNDGTNIYYASVQHYGIFPGGCFVYESSTSGYNPVYLNSQSFGTKHDDGRPICSRYTKGECQENHSLCPKLLFDFIEP